MTVPKAKCVPVSLKNTGNTCYLNAALQGITSCQYFIEDIKKLSETCEMKINKLNLFCDLILTLNNGKEKKMEITKHEIFENWKMSGQQDSFELLACVINEVYTDVRKYMEEIEPIKKENLNEWLLVSLPMRMIIENEIQCICETNFKNQEMTLALHVPILSNKLKKLNLQDLVDHCFNEQDIEDYYCPNNICSSCQGKLTIKLVQPIPRTICIHLQRMFWNGKKTVKINTKVIFEKHLIINDQFIKSCTLNANFNLMSFIVHNGKVNGGHYICYKTINNQWFRADDRKIKKVKLKCVFKQNPYILFYEQDNQVSCL